MALSEAEKIMNKINKQWLKKKGNKDNLLVDLDQMEHKLMEAISTGVPTLDFKALRIGGLPKGRVIELYGPKSIGKSTLGIQVAISCQKEGGTIGYIDVEHSLNLKYAKDLGLSLSGKDGFMFSQPNSAEQALDLMKDMVLAGTDLIILDSVAALVPKSELEDTIEGATVASLARIMGKALKQLSILADNNNTLLLFINQERDNIGYGTPVVTPGGKALGYHSSIQIRMKKKGFPVLEKSTPVAQKVTFQIKKNKVGPPLREVDSLLIFGKGFDSDSDYFDLAEELGFMVKSGSWYDTNFGDYVFKYHGMDKTIKGLKKEGIFEELIFNIKEHYKNLLLAEDDECVILDEEGLDETDPDQSIEIEDLTNTNEHEHEHEHEPF